MKKIKMKKLLSAIGIVCLLFSATSCVNKNKSVSLKTYADTANYFAKKIADIEARQDMSDIDLFMQMTDSANEQRTIADSVLASIYENVKDTIFLPFEQTKNFEKITIKKVWVVGMQFDKVLIEALVEANDNSSFMGPHAGLVVKDKSRNRLEVGGGIQGPTDDKLAVGEEYIFSGQIEHLHLLSNFKMLLFDEDIKKW